MKDRIALLSLIFNSEISDVNKAIFSEIKTEIIGNTPQERREILQMIYKTSISHFPDEIDNRKKSTFHLTKI